MSSPRALRRIASIGRSAAAGLLLIGTAAGLALKLPDRMASSSRPVPLRPDHLTMVVPDVAETVRWYESKLGFVQVAGFTHENEPTHALLARDANFIELIGGGGSSGPVQVRRNGMPAITVGRVPVLLDDVDSAIDSLREHGVEILAEPRDAGRRPLRVGLIRDLNGRTVELQQPL